MHACVCSCVQVRGIIFDSGPARVDEAIASKATVAALTRTPTDEVLSRQVRMHAHAHAHEQMHLPRNVPKCQAQERHLPKGTQLAGMCGMSACRVLWACVKAIR